MPVNGADVRVIPHTGRITTADLSDAAADLGGMADDVMAYVCGPPKMTDEVVTNLIAEGLPASNVHIEKWW